MKVYKLLNKWKIVLLWMAVLLSLATLLIFPNECRNGATNGVFLCLQVLIPSLFPFIILSNFISLSTLSAKAPKILSGFVSRIFGLPKCAVTPVLLSLIGGYPVGATAIKGLHSKGVLSEIQAERMAMFCVSAGPGFLITYIGSVMTRNLKLGYILLISQIISVLLLGLISRYTIKNSDAENCFDKSESISFSSKEAFVFSVESAIKSCAGMCALVIIFSGLSEVFLSLCKSPSFIWLTALIEITNGIKILADNYPAALISFMCGFGGLCVHFQIFVQLKGINISKCNFYIFRILQGLICASITAVLTRIFPTAKTVFSTISEGKTELYTTSVGCVFLVILCISFIICARQRRI